MEWKSNLRRAQSLRSVSSSCDQPTWKEAGLRGKITSVSQLVSRYQTTVEVSTSIQQTSVMNVEAKPKQLLKEITPSLEVSKDTHLEALMQRNEERQRSRAKTNLTRSKSMGSLQNGAGSIGALKALFESREDTQNKAKSSFRAASSPSPHKAADIMPMMNGAAEEVKSPAVKLKAQIPADAPTNDAKDEHVTRKVVNQTRTERRKTIGGIDFEEIAASQAVNCSCSDLPHRLFNSQYVCQWSQVSLHEWYIYNSTTWQLLPKISNYKHADEKRRSVADFRDSSFIQTKEKLSVSVKAMSALYLSKVASQESAQSLLKAGQDQSSEPGKRVKLTKMAEDSHQKKDDHAPPPSTRHQPEDISGPHFQQSMPPQLSKEKLHQQRQKCELRRLLKHTHPELKMLDDVVDEELAEVLSSETGVTTGETGYEGEVLSRRLIFENCALSDKVSPYTPKKHMAEGTLERGVSKTSAVFEAHEGRPVSESVKGIVEDHKILSSSADPHTESEEEMIRIDVQTTRRMFESQSVNTSRLYPDNKLQGKVSIPGDGTGAVQKQKQECRKDNLHSENKSNASTKSLDLTDQTHKRGPSVAIIGQSSDHELSGWEEDSTGELACEDEPTSLPHAENLGETIKTSAALFKNNPFIPTNIEREHSFAHTSKSQSPGGDSEAAQDFPTANVKNRAHLFESMPFDKIRQQNKDEVETMVENIKETLNSLYQVNAIHSGGSIIEVNETMIAKKAKFTLSEGGPDIKYDEVAEGGAQNFILQLLPRANLKPQITYLKEDSKGNMEATVLNVHVHQHQFTTSQDTEFKTANVVQVVEDILNQDNSLRKGVIIQEDVNRCAEIMVYSLYNYFDEDDVKSYCPPQGAEYDESEPERVNASKTDSRGLRKGTVESTISCLLETSKDPACQGSIRSETEVKGNVKLFKSCIEKGDLEYLKSLQAEPTEEEQELPPNQMDGQSMEVHHEHRGDQTEESASEWVQVDVKKLKNMFSGDQRPVQPKQNVYENLAPSTTIQPRDLGFLKSLQAESVVQEQQLGPDPHVDEQGMELHHGQRGDQTEESTSEWVPVDVKKLKNMFSGDPRPVQPKQNTCESLAHSTAVPPRDLGFLKSLQAETTVLEQELSPNPHVDGQGMELHHEQSGDQTEESVSEWVQVDVKRLKNMFSGDPRPVQPKQNTCESLAHSTTVPPRDFGFLKSHQAESVVQEQEIPPDQNVDGQGMELHHEQRGDQTEESASEWVQVDVKKLKNMFSGDQRPVQPKQNVYENLAHSTTVPPRDLGFLKSHQAESTVLEQELSPNPHVDGQGMELHHEQSGDQTEESASEWVQVDVKKLKNMFSGDPRPVQPKQNIYENIAKSSAISPGDLESMKSPQSASVVQEQELLPNQNVAGQSMEGHYEQRSDQAEEWVPVDVKKLKNMFSGDPRPVQPKQNAYENLVQSVTMSPGQNVPLGKSSSTTERNVEVSSPEQPQNTLRECGAQKQKEACNSLVAPQGSYLHLETPDDDRVHQAELVEVVDGDDEISNLQTAIHSLQQATIEAKSLYRSSKANQKFLVQESSKEPVVSATEGNVKHPRKEAELAQESEDQKEYPSEIQSASKTTSEHKSETGGKDTKSEEVKTMQTCNKMGQKCTGMVQKSVMVSEHSSEPSPAQQEDEEVVFQGKLQAALNSLERSNINVTKGDFRAAMIYRNSSKPQKEMSQNVDAVSIQKPTKEESFPVTEPKSTTAPLRQEVSTEQVTAANAEPPSQGETPNKAASSAVLEKGKRPAGPKPAIPQKPELLKVKEGDVHSTNTENPVATQTNTMRPNSCANTVGLQRNEPLDEAILNEARHQVQGSVITLLSDKTDKNIIGRQQEINVTAEEISPQDFSIKENINETDESHVNFHEACHKFGGKKARQAKNAPVKPKRVKIAQPDNKNRKHMSGDDNSSVLTHVVEQPQQTLTGPSCSNPNTCGQTADSKGKQGKEMKHESRVEMREKKGRTETEDERRQRLSVHMDEIMRGNITAAMEIFDNLRKQEELQSILSRVEEIEQDTSGVDVRSLRGIFENVPDWVVSSDNKKHKKVKAGNKGERMPLARDNTESKSSMAHVFGDLERASEEIMNLKEQTLARLLDIEGAIKKALYSVSTLKSESDIAGLSSLFKESLGAVQGSPTSGNISKISIGSSRTKSLESPITKRNPPLPAGKSESSEVASAKHRVSPSSSPAFISIESAARKADKSEVLPPETTICPTCQHSPKTEEKFRTTKTLACNSPAQNRKRDPRKGGQKQSSHSPLNPKRELSVLEVQTDREGNSIMGTTTVTENYERTDNFGNRFYSSKTSTVVTTQPETATSAGQAVVSQVTKYPEVQRPINQKP